MRDFLVGRSFSQQWVLPALPWPSACPYTRHAPTSSHSELSRIKITPMAKDAVTVARIFNHQKPVRSFLARSGRTGIAGSSPFDLSREQNLFRKTSAD